MTPFLGRCDRLPRSRPSITRHDDLRTVPCLSIIRSPTRAPALSRLCPPAADDPRRPAAREPDHLPRRRHQRRGRQPRGDEVPVPPVREPHAGHQLLHQQPRRQRQQHAGDLRHDAVHRVPRRHLLHRPGRLGRRGPAGRRHQGEAVRPAPLQDHDPPALRPGRRPGLGHRDPGRGNRQEPAGRSTRSSPSTPASRSSGSPRTPSATATSPPSRPRNTAWSTRSSARSLGAGRPSLDSWPAARMPESGSRPAPPQQTAPDRQSRSGSQCTDHGPLATDRRLDSGRGTHPCHWFRSSSNAAAAKSGRWISIPACSRTASSSWARPSTTTSPTWSSPRCSSWPTRTPRPTSTCTSTAPAAA